MTPPTSTTSSRGLLVGLAVGVPVMAYGVRGALVDAADTHPAELGRWIVGSAVIHDAVLIPLVALASWALRRVTPAGWWPAVRAGAATTGMLALVAWPVVRGYGRSPGNPSLFPRDYGLGLAVTLAAVWLATAAIGGALWLRRRGRSSRSAAPGP
jgi:hypothetical protein